MTGDLVPCALCVKYRDPPLMVSASKNRHTSGYLLCAKCAGFVDGPDG